MFEWQSGPLHAQIVTWDTGVVTLVAEVICWSAGVVTMSAGVISWECWSDQIQCWRSQLGGVMVHGELRVQLGMLEWLI